MANNVNFDTGNTMNLVNAGVVAGTTSTYTTTATTNCVISGKFATPLTAQTNAATPTTDATTGLAFNPLTANNCCVLVLGVGAAGTVKMAQGPITAINVGITTTPGGLLRDPQFPALPNDFCPLAYTVVSAAPSASAWTPGTGSWTASGISATTFANVSQLPNRPQSA